MQKTFPPAVTGPPKEKGIVVLMALLLGLVLSAGVSALLINQIFARKQPGEAVGIGGVTVLQSLLHILNICQLYLPFSIHGV